MLLGPSMFSSPWLSVGIAWPEKREEGTRQSTKRLFWRGGRHLALCSAEASYWWRKIKDLYGVRRGGRNIFRPTDAIFPHVKKKEKNIRVHFFSRTWVGEGREKSTIQLGFLRSGGIDVFCVSEVRSFWFFSFFLWNEIPLAVSSRHRSCFENWGRKGRSRDRCHFSKHPRNGGRAVSGRPICRISSPTKMGVCKWVFGGREGVGNSGGAQKASGGGEGKVPGNSEWIERESYHDCWLIGKNAAIKIVLFFSLFVLFVRGRGGRDREGGQGHYELMSKGLG